MQRGCLTTAVIAMLLVLSCVLCTCAGVSNRGFIIDLPISGTDLSVSETTAAKPFVYNPVKYPLSIGLDSEAAVN